MARTPKSKPGPKAQTRRKASKTSKAQKGGSNSSPKLNIDPLVLNILVCPKSRGHLTYDPQTHELISKKAKLAYPIRENVPILLIEEARPL